MRSLYLLGRWWLRVFCGRRGFRDGRAVSSGGVWQLYTQGRERQRLSTSVIRHAGDEDTVAWMERGRAGRCRQSCQWMVAMVYTTKGKACCVLGEKECESDGSRISHWQTRGKGRRGVKECSLAACSFSHFTSKGGGAPG